MSFIKGLFSGIVITSLVEAIFYFILYLRVNFWDNSKLLLGFHWHHSIIGLLIILIGLLFLQKSKYKSLFLLGFGLGIIIIHTLTDGRLIFIE